MRGGRQLNPNLIANLHVTTCQHDAHDTGFTDQLPLFVTTEDRLHQARLKLVKLFARVAQASHFNHGCRTNM